MNPMMMGHGNFLIDLIFNLLFVIVSFVIFYKTKEIYELTKYNGIKYFRYSFLFLGIGYFFRASTLLLRLFVDNFFMKNHFCTRLFWAFPINFFGILAIFYLFLSLDSKKGFSEKYEYLIYLFALLVSLLFYLTHSYNMLIIIQLLSLILVIVIHVFKNRNNIQKMFVIYSLLLVFWILNLFLMLPVKIFSLYTIVFVQIVSLTIMLYIFFKVFKWIK